MSLQVRRSTRGTIAAVLNLVLVGAAGVVTLGNEFVKPAASTAWLVVGLALLVWAALILSGLLRPVTVSTDDQGIAIRKLMGEHRFLWPELIWADFERNTRFAVVAARVEGKDRFAAISRRGVEAEDFVKLVEEVRARRPGLPTSAAEAQKA